MRRFMVSALTSAVLGSLALMVIAKNPGPGDMPRMVVPAPPPRAIPAIPVADAAGGTADPGVLRLGREYRRALIGAGLAQFEAAGARDGSAQDVAGAQREALARGIRSAWAPIAAELSARFGGPDDAPDPDAVRRFYRDLAEGFECHCGGGGGADRL